MRRVYRIEREDGRGPYAWGRGQAASRVYDAHNEDADCSHPGPHFTTGTFYMQMHEFSGCSTVKGLKNWFGEFWEDLLEEGYSMVAYDVDEEYVRDCSDSDQLAFRKGLADRAQN